MGDAVRGYNGAADDSTPYFLFVEAVSARFSAQQVVDQIFSDVQEEKEISDLEEEVSEEEVGEEYNPEYDASSSNEAERETF